MATITRSETIDVENPATGLLVRSVPVTPPEAVAQMAADARAAQPDWEALGFEGRGRVLRRMRKWLSDHSEEVSRTIVSETGKAYEDALFAEVGYGVMSLGFWAKNAPK